MGTQHLSLEQVESLTVQALTGVGASPKSASSMAKAVKAAERDGIPSHGLLYVPTYCEHVRCGKVDGNANPDVYTKLSSAYWLMQKLDLHIRQLKRDSRN